jgi:MFS family permease
MKFFKKDELKLLWPFYLDHLVSPMLFFMPAFMIIYFRDLNFSMFQVGILIALMPLFSLFFEIPTGAIADLYGRKFSVLLSYFIGGICFLLLFFFKDFLTIAVIFSISGIAMSLASGAKEAWIVDLIKNKDLLHGYFPKAQGLDSFGLIVSGFIGAFFVKIYGTPIIWIATGISFFLAFIILGFADEIRQKSKIKIKDSFKKVKRQSVQTLSYGYKHHVLFFFFLASAVLLISGNFDGQISWINFMSELGLPEYAFGYMWSAIGLMGLVAPIVSQRLLKKGREKKFIVNSLILCALVSFSVLFVRSLVFGFVVLLIGAFLSQLRTPAERIYFHRFIPSRLRATMGSVEGMMLCLVGVIAVPLAGLLVDVIGARYTISLSAVALIVGAIVYSRIKE